MINKLNNKKRGSSLVELIFYICIFSVLSLAVINSMLTMVKSLKETSLVRDLMGGSSVLERMSREIRQANSINTTSSSDIVLNTKDGLGNSKTIEFALSGSDILLKENGVLTGNLNSPNLIITGLSFSQITTVKGTAVKFSISAKSSRDLTNRIENFYDTIVLRGDY